MERPLDGVFEMIVAPKELVTDREGGRPEGAEGACLVGLTVKGRADGVAVGGGKAAFNVPRLVGCLQEECRFLSFPLLMPCSNQRR